MFYRSPSSRSDVSVRRLSTEETETHTPKLKTKISHLIENMVVAGLILRVVTTYINDLCTHVSNENVIRTECPDIWVKIFICLFFFRRLCV